MKAQQAFEHFWDAPWPLPGAEEAVGAGCFGHWGVDGRRLPIYAYEMDHECDGRAAYRVRTGRVRTGRVSAGVSRDHWHLIGNDRITATVHNGGYVQVYDWSRGGKALNRWNPGRADYAGGFKFISIGGETLCTLWNQLPSGVGQDRIFGMGYFEKRTVWNGLVVTERIEAPVGDDPVLVSSCTVENTLTMPCQAAVTEYWGHAIDHLLPAPLAMPPWNRLFGFRRWLWNRHFRFEPAWDAERGILSVAPVLSRRRCAPGRAARALRDYYPKTVFLAALDALPAAYQAYCTDKRRFFGQDRLGSPPGAVGAGDGALSSGRGNAILAMRREIVLAPGEKQTVRYVFGYADKEDVPRLARVGFEPAPRPAVEFVAPDAPGLQRELAWHSCYLQAGSIYSDYYQAHIVDQGSAYSYLHGLSGASRDFALFILPMVYMRPDLAKDMLRFCARLQRHGDGKLPYGLVGHGCVRGYGVHSKSSDLDLFFLWAASEYLAATQDRGFLDEPLPFYPLSKNASGTFLDHCRAAFHHLQQRVGLGPHGLLRCGTGDWNDVLLGYSRFSPLTVWRGESALNAGLAAMVLPRIADALEHADAALAGKMRGFARVQSAALERLWMGDWLMRGYLGYGEAALGRDRLFLDAQPFPVLAGLWDANRRARLFDTVQTQCVAPQRAGALCLWPPMKGPLLEPGSDTNGGTWAAIDGWLAWAWSLHDPKAAWDFFRSTTLAARAEAYPEVWYGVWSGPDSYNAHYHPRPGETFQLNATPMTDYPVMNMNRHANPLFAALKMAGIDPRGDTIVLDPHLPFDTFAIRTPLLGVAYDARAVRGYYRPVAAGTFHFAVRPPAAAVGSSSRSTEITLHIDGQPAPFQLDETGRLRFTAQATPPHEIRWEITR